MDTAASVEPVVKSKARPKVKPKVKTPVKTPVKNTAKPAIDPALDSAGKLPEDPAVKPPVDSPVKPPVNSAVKPGGEEGSPVTPKVPKKRGRPVGWRKYKEGESPPAKPKKARKSKTSVSSPLAAPAAAPAPAPASSSSSSQLESGECVVSSTENMETPGRATDNTEARLQLNKSAEDLPILPPKKFFKSKAALKEPVIAASVTVSPPPSPPNHEHERDNFRSWLDAKLSGQNGVESEGIIEGRVTFIQPVDEILAIEGRVSLLQPWPLGWVQNIVE